MKTLLTSLLLVLVSQHALAAVVEVYEGVMSVLLPCKYSGFIPEDNPTVLWTRSDLNPKYVHVRREEADDLRGQNQRYSGRTSMRSDALDSLDFSLTLRNPTKTDSSNYTCSISDGTEDQRLRDIQLQVKDQQVEVKVVAGSESVILPCQIKPDLPEDTTVEWTRADQELVHVYSNRSDDLTKQDRLYRDRTKMNKDLLRTGDLSLTLKYPTERDSGGYICTIYRDKDILRQKVVLQVKEPFPSWATALLVFLLLVLVVSAVLLFNFWHHIMSFIPVAVEVAEGAESVQLPFKTTRNLPEDVKVLWERYDPRMKAHVYHNGSDLPEEQSEVYRGRTRMKGDPLRTGDLSLTVEQPTERDSGEYKCLVWRRGDFIRKKTEDFRSRIKLLVSSSDMNHHSSTSSTVVKALDCKQPFSHVSASCHTRELPVKGKSSSISSLCIIKLPTSVSEDDDSRWWSFQISVFGHKITDVTHNDGEQHHCSISGAGYSCVYFKGMSSNMRISSMCALSERMWLH